MKFSSNSCRQLYPLLLNCTDGLIPDPNQPFFIDALNLTKVSLNCTFNGNGTPVSIFHHRFVRFVQWQKVVSKFFVST